MNQTRRAALETALDNLERARDEFRQTLLAARLDLEGIRDEEQDAFESLAETLQIGTKGQSIQETLDALDNLIAGIDDQLDTLDDLDLTNPLVE